MKLLKILGKQGEMRKTYRNPKNVVQYREYRTIGRPEFNQRPYIRETMHSALNL